MLRSAFQIWKGSQVLLKNFDSYVLNFAGAFASYIGRLKMRKLDENSKDIQKLEEEIRKLGMPYSGTEPEPLYWANFRVRVMDRIQQRQKPWPARVMEFFAEHVLATSISAAVACLIVAAYLAFQPVNNTPQLAVTNPPTVTPQLAAPDLQTMQPPPSPVKEPIPVHRRAEKTYLAKKSDKTDDLAVAEPLAASSSDQAVSLESLSQSELESVLAGIESDSSDN